MAVRSTDRHFEYDESRSMLYALAVGFGRDPSDPDDLRFVYEQGLVAVPTMATVIAWGIRDLRALGIDYGRMLHGGQRVVLHRPLPTAARIVASAWTRSIHDKGADKGAIIISETSIRDAETGEPICTLEGTNFARGDGGFAARGGGDSGPSPRPAQLPTRDPDMRFVAPTDPGQALLYRLLGDRNPLHADPAIARAAGFPRPILQGLCTFGICCRAVLKTQCDHDPSRIRDLGVRFVSPVVPGETLSIDLWRDGDVVGFRAHVRTPEGDRLVVDNGRCVLGA